MATSSKRSIGTEIEGWLMCFICLVIVLRSVGCGKSRGRMTADLAASFEVLRAGRPKANAAFDEGRFQSRCFCFTKWPAEEI
jgi:hypothetical protein